MHVIERIVVECHVQEDWTGSDDIKVSLDGRQIGRLAIKDRNILMGTSAESIYPEGDASVRAGSRLVIEEIDLLDPNDVLLDHTFTEEEIQSGHVAGSGGGDGMYRFGNLIHEQAG